MTAVSPVPRRARRLAVLVCALVLVLAGCARIPTTGPVGEGGRNSGAQGREAYQIQPFGPVEGQSQSQAVLGFLAAGVGVDDDYAVARQFLAATEQGRWRPDAGVMVYDSSSSLKTTVQGPDRVTVDVPVVATVDDQGRYRQAPSGTVERLDFRLDRVGDQWKIVGAPDGIVLSALDFPVIFDSYDVYFYDQSFGVLVPEMRWFAHRAAVPTQLVRAVLAGPSPWLRDAVRTAFPAGTKLAIDAVSVQDGTARVDLDTGVLDADAAQRQRMARQLEATLAAVTGVRRVQITVQQAALDIPGATSVRPVPRSGVRNDAGPVMLSHGRLVRLEAGRLRAVADLPDLGAEQPAHPATAPVDAAYAVIARGGGEAEDRLLVLTPNTPPREALRGEDLTPPSFDVSGWVWSSAAAGDGTVTAVGPRGQVAQLRVPWLAGRRIVSLRVSLDGTRALVVSEARDGTRVDVAGIVRGDQGAPQALAQETLQLAPDIESVRDAAWVTDDTVVLLGRMPGASAPAPVLAQVGGGTTMLATVPGAVSVAAGAGPRDVLVGTQDGQLFGRAGSGWSRVAQDVTDPSFGG